MSNLLAYLERAASRPEAFLGSRRLRHLRLHLDGWRAHRAIIAEDDWFADAFFDRFHAFVGHRYDDRRSLGWDGLIAAYEPPERHFRTFMALVTEFAGRNGTTRT